jgi:hypothetical protein
MVEHSSTTGELVVVVVMVLLAHSRYPQMNADPRTRAQGPHGRGIVVSDVLPILLTALTDGNRGFC